MRGGASDQARQGSFRAFPLREELNQSFLKTTSQRVKKDGLIATLCGWSGYLRLTSPHANLYDGNDLTRQIVKMWGGRFLMLAGFSRESHAKTRKDAKVRGCNQGSWFFAAFASSREETA